jgi:hypothetical protein
MRIYFSIGLIFLLSVGRAQPKPDRYINPEVTTETHSAIAILPFYCLTNPEDFSKDPDYQRIQEQQLGLNLQSRLYHKMISFSDRFTVSVQDVTHTNHMLREAGISDYRFPDVPTVARLLNVDAVIFCVVTYDAGQFLEENSLKQLLERQQVPTVHKNRDTFLSLFSADGTCIITCSSKSQLLSSFVNYETMASVYLFGIMQYLPYWKGDRIKIT